MRLISLQFIGLCAKNYPAVEGWKSENNLYTHKHKQQRTSLVSPNLLSWIYRMHPLARAQRRRRARSSGCAGPNIWMNKQVECQAAASTLLFHNSRPARNNLKIKSGATLLGKIYIYSVGFWVKFTAKVSHRKFNYSVKQIIFTLHAGALALSLFCVCRGLERRVFLFKILRSAASLAHVAKTHTRSQGRTGFKFIITTHFRPSGALSFYTEAVVILEQIISLFSETRTQW